MKSDALTLEEALNATGIRAYLIPQYQRPYTWEKDNFETLWEDLMDSYNEYIQLEKEGKVTEKYFLGPVVFVKNEKERSFDIIDGQQRTTTFHIILWYLFHKVEDETEKALVNQILTFLGKDTKLKVSANDAATFLTIRDGYKKEIVGTSKMSLAAVYFREKVSKINNADSFSKFLREKTQFIVIVADDYNKAWDLFIGLNGKGEPLNPTDLVKAFVCGRSDIGEDIGKVWENSILPLHENSTSFLLFLARYKTSKFITENALFKEFTKNFPSIISSIDIVTNSKIYNLFWLKPVEEIPNDINETFRFTEEAKKALRNIRSLDRKDFTFILFKYCEAFGISSIFEENFLKAIASYQLRMALSRKRSRERKFVSEFKDIVFRSTATESDAEKQEEQLKKDKLRAFEQLTNFMKTDAPDDDQFETFVSLSDYSSYPARIILRSFEEGERGNKKIDDFQLEHLMPKTGTDFWYKEAESIEADGKPNLEKYSSLVNRIGNLFVVDATSNNEVKNKPYSKKKAVYQDKLKDWSISRITKDKTSWNSEDIKNRCLQIAAWAKDYWKI